MAVKVLAKGLVGVDPRRETHEKGRSWSVKDGDLWVFASVASHAADQLVAVYAAGQWISAEVVAQEV